MDKYAQLNSFHRDHRLQVYMYDFMYVDPETMSVEDHFTDKNKIKLWTTRKFQLKGQPQNIVFDLVAYVQKIMS